MGFSKKTGKGRLDKYYYLAKEHGYRARSAFKIKQLDQKFKFLERARVLVDLCAAPGGWLQVAAECMPMSHVIIGVDLVPIKPIKGVCTIVGDITTDKCRSEIRKELKGWKADVVLHDGAPNVGNAWIQDAFSQAELALHSFKLASEFLVDGGVFVTKVFRSKEYPLVLAALKKYFKVVDATKPESSRSVSAEIFLHCKHFLSQSVRTDPIVIRDILAGNQDTKPNALVNILHPEKRKVNRDGYEDGATTLHKEITLTDFLNTKDPEQALALYNAIAVGTPDEHSYVDSMKDATDLKSYCADLKVLGRREFKALLKIHKIFKSRSEKPAVAAENPGEAVPEDPDAKLFDEYKSQLRAQKKKNKKIARLLEQSQNHADLSFDQELIDEDDCEEAEASVDANKWFSTPMFQEVFDEFNYTAKHETKGSGKEDTLATRVGLDAAEDDAAGKQLASSTLPPLDEDEIIDLTYNRRAFDDDNCQLPEWFVDDEGRHNIPQEPITKEVADLLRENDRLMKNRLPKKVLEAKNRQKMRSLRKLQSLKKKASVIAESEEIGDGQKISQIRKLLSKAKVTRSRPKVVVAKGKLKALKGRPQGVKGRYKMVDRRMIKDLRAQKRKLARK